MKITLEVTDCDHIVIAALQESAMNILACDTIIDEDRKYTKKYVKAVNRVLEHFGGDPVYRDND